MPAKTFHPRGQRVTDLTPFPKNFSPQGQPHVSDLAGVTTGRVLLVADDGEPLSLNARLWDNPVPLGGPTIEALSRPLRRSLTAYRGIDGLGISLSIWFDGWAVPKAGPIAMRNDPASAKSVEPQCRKVEKMAGMFVPDDPGPPRLIVCGPGVPHCWGPDKALRRRWVVAEPPAWGDEPSVIRDRHMNRVRQQVTLTLLLATEVHELQRVAPRQKKPASRTIHAKKHDTYRKIARRELDTPRLGRRLARFNGASDPHKELHEGKKVKLPSKKVAREWREALKGK